MFISAVVLTASAVVAFALSQTTNAAPAPFVGLLIASVLTSSISISLPLAGSGSTLSFSYVASVASLLALGTWPTVLLSAATGLSQGVVGRRPRHPAAGRSRWCRQRAARAGSRAERPGGRC